MSRRFSGGGCLTGIQPIHQIMCMLFPHVQRVCSGRERGAKALEERLGSKSTVEVKESEAARNVDLEAGGDAIAGTVSSTTN